MFILIIAGGFPHKNAPLLGIFEYDQAKALQEFGHKVVYVSLDLRSIRRKRKIGKYWSKHNNIDILNISIPLGPIHDNLFINVGKAALINIFPEIVKKQGFPDIIHAHFTKMGNIASIIKDKFNIPLVITEHSSAVNKTQISKKLSRTAYKGYSKADSLISVSSGLSENIKSNFNLDSIVIPNIVDTSYFSFNPKSKSNNFIFISTGNLTYNKGFDLLIDAFKNASFNKDVQLKIIGDGPLYRDLQLLVDSFELSNQISLLGYLSRLEIATLMNKSDVFVLASRSETFGVSYIEAMMSGLPVIGTKCGGPEDFITKENGLLVQANNVGELTEALLKMHRGADSYDKQKISELCKENFSPSTIAQKLTTLYNNILNL